MTSMIDSSSAGAERRERPRYRDTSPVLVGDGAIVRQCTLLDVSEGGVRIAVGTVGKLPYDVALVDPCTGLSHRAKLVWQSDTEAGLRFVGEGVRYRVMTAHKDLRHPMFCWAS